MIRTSFIVLGFAAAIYVGSYFAFATIGITGIVGRHYTSWPSYRCGPWATSFYTPMHTIDRRILRPTKWHGQRAQVAGHYEEP
jgi:hypothetical protein